MILTQQQRVAGLSLELARNATLIRQALQQGKIDEAERVAKSAFSPAPRHAEILLLIGELHNARGRHEMALDALSHARELRPNDALVHSELGAGYEALNDFDNARQSFRTACATGAEYPSCWFNLGRRLMRDGDFDGAIAALQRSVALEPNHAPARAMLATVLQADGRTAEAEAEYRRAAATGARGSGGAWSGLATLKPMPLSATDIDVMRRLLQTANLVQIDRIAIGFALAMALEHAGDYRGAFRQLADAHALARRSERYDAAAFRRYLDALLAAFDGTGAVSAVAQGGEVIFIVGLPRSGSTLIEQILASHSQVHGAIELLDLPEVLMEQSDRMRQPLAEWGATQTPAQWQTLGENYLRRTRKWRAEKPRCTDKSPGNWQYVGAILAMLPNARVIVARRDALETCLGCYRYMITEYAYAHDFQDLADHWRDFDRAVAHWATAYPDRVREQHHEALVDDPENQIRELLAFCDLPFEPACLDFHATERRVSTPSASQVREPLRRDTARAARYGALLDPLRMALGMAPFTEAAGQSR